MLYSVVYVVLYRKHELHTTSSLFEHYCTVRTSSLPRTPAALSHLLRCRRGARGTARRLASRSHTLGSARASRTRATYQLSLSAPADYRFRSAGGLLTFSYSMDCLILTREGIESHTLLYTVYAVDYILSIF